MKHGDDKFNAKEIDMVRQEVKKFNLSVKTDRMNKFRIGDFYTILVLLSRL